MKAQFCKEENMNNTEIKTLNECKEYFKKLYTDCLVESAFEQSIFDSTEKARYEMFCDTLNFIYGKKFEKMKPFWIQEASNEYFSTFCMVEK